MEMLMPTASRTRLEELLDYLGNTENYSKYYEGNRAEDFKKCFDIESEYCMMYADLLMRGLEKRELGYAERHHGIPVSFYRKCYGYTCHRYAKKLTEGNIFILTFGEHLYAHLLAVRCARTEYAGACAAGFWKMYNCNSNTKRALPEDIEVINLIDEKEALRIRSMIPRIAAVDARGGTHRWEDAKKAQHENKERFMQNNPTYFKDYYADHLEERRQQSHDYSMEHKEEKQEYDRKYRAVNRERIRKNKKEYASTHREQLNEHNRLYNSSPERKQKRHEEYIKRKPRALELCSKRRKEKYDLGYRIRNGQWVFLGPDAPPIRKPVQPVNQYKMDGTFIASYGSIKEAADANGLQLSLIGHVCRGKRKSTGGYIFKYANELNTATNNAVSCI